ncbi:hypothetical protein [Haloparvum sp. PAK95]|uniref:hypothetical protein n=1 Tax=Haloparvum sp. PAK95 TaxID=3418962 RepID=UPI003D2F472B
MGFDIFRRDFEFFSQDRSDRSTGDIRENHPAPRLSIIHRCNPIGHVGHYMVDETLDLLVNRLLNLAVDNLISSFTDYVRRRTS